MHIFTSEYGCHMESVPEKCIQVHRCPVGDPSSCVTNEVCTGRTTERVCGMERVSHSGSYEVEYYSTATESIEINLFIKFIKPACSQSFCIGC